MKKVHFTLLLLLVSAIAWCQPDLDPKRIRDFMKKEKGKWGIYLKDKKEWVIPATYDKISAAQLRDDKTDALNGVFYKCWLGKRFDVLYVPAGTTPERFEITLRNVDAFDLTIWLNPTDEFLLYQRDGKWGWHVVHFKTRVKGEPFNISHYTHPNYYDKAPYVFPTLRAKAYDDWYINADSAGLKGAYTLQGKTIVPPGPYDNFQIEESYVILHGTNGLKGFVYQGALVAPVYKEVMLQKDYKLPIEMMTGKLPSGEREYFYNGRKITEEQLETTRAQFEQYRKSKQ